MPDLLTNGKASYTLNQAAPPLVTVGQSEPHLWSTSAQTRRFDQCHPVFKWAAMTMVLSLEHPNAGKKEKNAPTLQESLHKATNAYMQWKPCQLLWLCLKRLGGKLLEWFFNDYWKLNYNNFFHHVSSLRTMFKLFCFMQNFIFCIIRFFNNI